MELYSLLPGESIELRAKVPDQSRVLKPIFVSSWDEMDDAAAKWDLDYDVYFGVAPRVPDGSGDLRGRMANIARVPVIWLDLDAKGDYSKDDRLRQLQEAPPSVLVDSGNGYHAYWRLDRSMDPKDAQRLMKRMAAHYDCDPTSDPTRVLRVPGTLNHKTDPPKFVELIRFSDNGSWSPDALPQADLPDDLFAGGSSADRERRAWLIENHGIPEGGCTLEGEEFPGRDAAMFELARYLRDGYSTPEDALERLHKANALNRPPLDDETLKQKVRSAWTQEAPPLITEVVETASNAPHTAFMVQSMADIMRYEEPATEWIADGVLARGHIVYTMNPPKSGKTTVALNLALRMAAGKSGAGLFIKEPHRVLFLQPMGDMHPTLTREWAKKIREGLELDASIPFHLAVLGERHDHFAYLSENAGDYDVVVVDTISRLFPAVDDKDTRTVSEELDKIRRLRMKYPHVCWLYLVQVGKNSLEHLRGPVPGFAARGNSAISEVFDDALQIIVPTKDAERDEDLGLNLTRHIAMVGRGASSYRRPWRTRFDPETHVIEWVQDLTYDEAIESSSTGEKTTAPTKTSQAADLLGRLFLDAQEATGQRAIPATEALRIGEENGFTKRVMKLALHLRGGTFNPARGPKATWWDGHIEVEE